MGRPRLFDLDAAVASALNVFWERGYGATTPAKLLDAIGVGKGSFYNAFGSKHALFKQALRRYADNRVAGLSRLLADSGPASQRISGYFARLAAPENEAALRRGCFATNTAAELSRSDPAAKKIVQRTFERMESVLEAALREGQPSGEPDDDAVDPKAVASLLLATLIGITVLARVDGSSLRTKRIARAVAALLNNNNEGSEDNDEHTEPRGYDERTKTRG
jgi:TetR/AcrR family transcriptional regulator, transcriptional repressor for nem operon